jgi:predicted ATPase
VTYYLQFASTERGFQILKESIAASASPQGSDFNYYMTRAFQEASVRTDVSTQDFQTFVLSPADAFLSQFKNPGDTTPTTRIGNSLSQIRIYREFRSGLQAAARLGASTLAPKDSLADGGDNLALVLQELDFRGVHDQIREYLGRFCERFEDVKVSIGEGLARLFMREAGLREMVAAARLSDGTLKFLSLLVALFHPNKAPLVCIEEPETGLHPDAMRLVAEVLIDASRRTQIIVTTHSEALIDALSDTPESVMVCERGVDLGTQMKRLEKESLMDWLKDYTLGQLWRKGEIGGNSD